jgi:hypothetical protein
MATLDFNNLKKNDLMELQVLQYHNDFDNAYLTENYRPDYDISIEYDNKQPIYYEVKAQQNNNDEIFIEVAEVSIEPTSGRFIEKNKRFKEWFKTGLLLSKADKYVLIRHNKGEYNLGDSYLYYEIDKSKIDEPIKKYLKEMNTKFYKKKIKLSDELYNQVKVLGEQAYQFQKKGRITSDPLVINNYGALKSMVITSSDWNKEAGKWNIGFKFNISELAWDVNFNGIHSKFEISNFLKKSYQGVIQEEDDEGNYIYEQHFKYSLDARRDPSEIDYGFGKNGDSSGSSSESEEERKDLRKFFNKLTNKIKSMKK